MGNNHRMSTPEPEEFSRSWVSAWNAHDVEAVLEHFADDVVFTSPVAARALEDSDGGVHGKEALRAYWTFALDRVPDLHFEVVGVYAGINTIVINYRNHNNGLVNEVLVFSDGLVSEGHGTYLGSSANPTSS